LRSFLIKPLTPENIAGVSFFLGPPSLFDPPACLFWHFPYSCRSSLFLGKLSRRSSHNIVRSSLNPYSRSPPSNPHFGPWRKLSTFFVRFCPKFRFLPAAVDVRSAGQWLRPLVFPLLPFALPSLPEQAFPPTTIIQV